MVDGYSVVDGDLAYPKFGIGSDTLKLSQRWEFIDSIAGQTIQFCLSDSLYAYICSRYKKIQTSALVRNFTSAQQHNEMHI